MTELLPCPFCGSPANLRRFAVSKDEITKISNMVSHIQCVNDDCCKVTVDIQHMNEAVAVEAWNTRAPTLELATARLRLEEAADEVERLHERCDAYKGQVKCGSEEISRLRKQLADAEATLFKLNSGEELQSLMKLNNELRSQLERTQQRLVETREALGELYKFWATHNDHRPDAPIMRRAREAFITSEQFALSDEVGKS